MSRLTSSGLIASIENQSAIAMYKIQCMKLHSNQCIKMQSMNKCALASVNPIRINLKEIITQLINEMVKKIAVKINHN
jgi:hypothetical protein